MLNLLSKINKFLIVIVFFGLKVSAASLPGDFESVFSATKQNNADLKRLQAEAATSHAKLFATRSYFLPRLGLESRYQTFDSKFDQSKGGTSNAFLDWNVFNGFKDYSLRNSADLEVQKTKSELDRFEKSLKWKVKAIYSKAFSLQKSVELYKQAVFNNQKILQTVKTRKSSGLMTNSEFLEFDLFDSKLKSELNSIESDFDIAMTDLKSMTAAENIETLTTDLKTEIIQIKTSDIEQVLISQKSKLSQSILSLKEAQSLKEVSSGGFFPQINLKATYGSLGLRETTNNPETTFGISLRWEFFSGFETVAAQRVSAALVSQKEAELSQQKIQLKSEVEQLLRRLQNIVKRLEIESGLQTKIENYLKAVTEEYRRGVKNSLDLKSAAESALQSSINIVKLKSEYFEVREKLHDILGVEI